MPPRKKTSQKQQQSVKELLQKKQVAKVREIQIVAEEDEKDDSESIQLPFFFSKHTDILPVPVSTENVRGDHTYHCSTMARVWFRQHSNLDEIVEAHMKKITVKIHPTESYTNAVIRTVTSAPLRKNDVPYNRFRFDSPANEIISRTLLTNPRIRTQPDLDEFIKFQNKYQLKLLEVPMYVNNAAHEDAQNFIKEKRKKSTGDCLIFQRSSLYWWIQRKYYEREDIIEDVYIRNLSLEQLESISNFKKVCLKMMEHDDINEYKTYADVMLHSFKTVPGASLIHPQFAVHPRYNLICNIMTVEQQHAIADNYRWFYDRTNAGKIHKRLQDGSTRAEFHERYRSRDDYDRKLPPFHNMYYMRQDDEGEREEEHHPEPQMTYANVRERFVRNEELPAEVVALDDDLSSETSRDTIVPQPAAAPEIQFPAKYFADPKPSSDELSLMKLLIQEKRFVFQVKHHLNEIYKKNFCELWSKHKQFILMNYLHNYWEGDNLKALLPFIERCSLDSRTKAKEIILNRVNRNIDPPQEEEQGNLL